VYKVGDRMAADDPKMSLFKSVVAQIYWVSAFVFARLGKPAEAISGDMRLSHTFQVLAMTRSEVPDR
jgi:hypothetical protein